jgi:hypothetical protein
MLAIKNILYGNEMVEFLKGLRECNRLEKLNIELDIWDDREANLSAKVLSRPFIDMQ